MQFMSANDKKGAFFFQKSSYIQNISVMMYVPYLLSILQEGRTECMKNELDPKFVRVFPLDYYFETVQKLKIAVYDMDNSTESVKDDDFLGQIECTLGQV